MSKYYGNIIEDDTIELTFNTFDADGESVTATTLISTDVQVYKDGVIQTTPGAGVTLTLNIGTGDGAHLIAIDTSNTTDAGFYATGSNYEVRLDGMTVATKNINAFVGSFSIENRYMVGTDGANTVVPMSDADSTTEHGITQNAIGNLQDFDPDLDAVANVTLVATTTTNTDMVSEPPAMVGTDNAALASVCTETRLAELDAGNLPTDIAAIPTTMVGTDNAATSAKQDTMETTLNAAAVDATVAKESTVDSVETKVDTVISTGSTGPWTTGGGGGGDATEAKQDLIIQMQEADETFVPAAGTLTKYAKGTATEILKKNLKDPDGNAVDSTEDIIAATEDVAV